MVTTRRVNYFERMSKEEYAALEAKLDRMVEWIQQEFMRQRAEMADFRAEMTGFRAETNGRLEALRVEMAERFESVLNRLDLVERQVARTVKEVQEIRVDLQRLDALQKSVNSLSDDMRQRFRVVSERLVAVEKRLAA
jgi:hypothetical protein